MAIIATSTKQQHCVGNKKMLVSLLIVALSVNGGLYLGTIAWSAYKSSEAGKIVEIFEKVRPFPLV
jgi:hypothetical protein